MFCLGKASCWVMVKRITDDILINVAFLTAYDSCTCSLIRAKESLVG